MAVEPDRIQLQHMREQSLFPRGSSINYPVRLTDRSAYFPLTNFPRRLADTAPEQTKLDAAVRLAKHYRIRYIMTNDEES